MTETTQIPVPAKKSGKWRIILGLLLALIIFLTGAISGAGVTMIVALHKVQQAIHKPEMIPPRMAAEMQRRLKLSDQQERQVELILIRRQNHLQTIRQRIQPDVMKQFEQTRAEVDDVLTPEQKEKWDRWYEQLKMRWLPKIQHTDENTATFPAE